MLRTGKRIGAALLAAALLIGQLEGAAAYAEGPPRGTGGLCEHHKAHDAACGYVEAIPGHACEHKHTPDCYTGELICGMDEDAEQTATSSGAGHKHRQECYRLDCPHARGEHKVNDAKGGKKGGLGSDGACGYIEAVPGTPCGYICGECGKAPDKDNGAAGTTNGNGLPAPEEPETGEPGDMGMITVTAFDKLDDAVKYQTVPAGTALDGLALPATLGAAGYAAAGGTGPTPEPVTITGVTWELTGENDSPATYEEGRETPCNYYFQPVLPEGYTLGGGAALPKIEVRYGWAARAMSSPNPRGGDRYHDGDVAAFKEILAAHPELASLPGVDVDDPKSWGGELVGWDATTKRLISLYLNNKGVEGTLDVSGLSELVQLRCFDNPELTGLTLGSQNHLTDLHCSNTGISGELDVSGCSELDKIWCNETPKLTSLKLGQLTDLTDLQCRFSGISGELDVSECSRLATLGCSETPALTALKLGQLTDLTDLKCSASGLKGTLDVSNCPRLETLWCHDNPELTDLKLGMKNDLTRFRCSFTGLSGTLDVSGCPKLKSLWCSDTPALTGLVLGTQNDLTDLFCATTRIKGTLDVSGCPKLQMLFCSDNPDLTALKLAPQNQLTSLLCVGTGLSGTLDVSNCPHLLTLSCNDNKLETLDVSGTALTRLDCLDNLLTSFTTTEGNTLTVEAGTGGRACMTDYDLSTNSAELTATPDSGYMFEKWEHLPAGDAGALTTRFALSDHIRVRAVFAPIKTPVTGVTLDQSVLTLTPGGTAALAATVEPADASYKAVIWESSNHSVAAVSDGAVTAVAPGTAAITVTTMDGSYKATCTVTVNSPDPDNGNDRNDGGNDRDDDTSYHFITAPKPNNPVLAVIELPVTVENGTAAGRPDEERTALAIAEAEGDATARTNGIAVQYNAETNMPYDDFSIVIQRAISDRLIDAKVKYVTLNTGIVDLTFDLAALKEIAAQSTGDITLTATQETGLTGDALAAAGTRPAYRLSVNYTGKDGKAAAVQNLGAGRVTVGLAYTPAPAEQTGSLFLVYSADGNGVEWLHQSSYDFTSGNVLASTGHFSVYGVGCMPAPAFTDTVNHWAKADIDFVASRGLLAGTGDATFTPDGPTTRGMFVVALGRLAGIDPAAYPSSRFDDVAATACYAPYVEWAVSKGIITGTGEKTFSPDSAITREQMAAIMQRYAEKLGYPLPVAREAEIFADWGQISSDMKDAVQAMQQAGVMNSKDGHRFGPKDTATRAEAAAVLRRFTEIVIDPAAAGGWGQDDDGRWLYYENNKPVTGWKQLDGTWYYFDAAGLMQAGGWREIGGKWYYFFPDGAMAVNT